MKVKIRSVHFLPPIDIVLLMLVICMNVNRYYLGGENGIIIYTIYFFYLVSALCLRKERIFRKLHITNNNYQFIICLSFFVLYVLIRSFEHGINGIEMAVKFIISLFIAFFASCTPLNDMKKLYGLIIIYNIIYCVLLILFPKKATIQLASGITNYLNITITIGLLMSLSLCILILSIYILTSSLMIIIAVLISLLALFTMTMFNSRGSVLIPILVMIIVLFLISAKKPHRIVIATLVLCTIGYFGIKVYQNNTSAYVYGRMMRMFVDTESEPRILIWSNYIKELVTRKWYIFGGGTNSSKVVLGYYPHNIYMQLLGEFGIVGLCISIVVTVKIFRIILDCKKKFMTNDISLNKSAIFFYLTVAAFFYYWLSFMKSYSFFDSYPLIIFGAILIGNRNYIFFEESIL